MNKAILIGLMVSVCSASVMADEVNNANITTFTAGTPAVATQVNGNFSEVIAAINDNAQRIAVLEASAGGTADLSTLVTGSTYRILFSGSLMATHTDTASSNEYGFLNGWAGSLDVTLNDGGLAAINFLGETSGDMALDASSVCDALGENCVTDFNFQTQTDTTGPNAGSWTLTGSTLDILFPDDPEPVSFIVMPNGQLIVHFDGGINQEPDGDGTLDEFETSIAIGVKTAP